MDHRLLDPHPLIAPVLLRRELVDRGWNDRSIRRALLAGELVRLRWGSYVSGSDWHAADWRGQHLLVARSVLRRAGADACLSHTSSLVLDGAPRWGLDLSVVHVTRRDGKAGRREAGVVQHRGVVTDDDLQVVEGVPATVAARSLMDTARLVDTEVAVVQTSDFLHRGVTTPELLRACSVAMAGWPDTIKCDLVTALAREELESVGEARFFYLCFHFSLPVPELQREVRDEDGRLVARLDFAWPELGCWIEFDGKVKYEGLLRPGQTASDVVVREKRREDEVRRLTGWRCLRITWADLESPARLAAKIRRFLDAGRGAAA